MFKFSDFCLVLQNKKGKKQFKTLFIKNLREEY